MQGCCGGSEGAVDKEGVSADFNKKVATRARAQKTWRLLFPKERTFRAAVLMSGKGQLRTLPDLLFTKTGQPKTFSISLAIAFPHVHVGDMLDPFHGDFWN